MPAQSPARRRGSGAKTDTDGPETSQQQPTALTEEAAPGGASGQEGGVSEQEGGGLPRQPMTAAEQAALRRKLRDKFH